MIIWKYKGPRVAKAISQKNNKVREVKMPYLKLQS